MAGLGVVKPPLWPMRWPNHPQGPNFLNLFFVSCFFFFLTHSHGPMGGSSTPMGQTQSLSLSIAIGGGSFF
jgi:hypothetical protein